MENGSEINLNVTNDLHFRQKKVCGTQIASNKTVKSMSMFDRPPIQCPKNALDYLTARQRTVASNVANINTQGYKTRDVSFEAVMRSKNEDLRLRLKTTHERHIAKPFEAAGGAETIYAYGAANKDDGINDVDLDKEMLKLGEIQTNYTLFSNVLTRKYQSIKRAIDGTP